MSRQDTLDEIKTTLGIVPGFLEGMPDMALEQTWGSIKDFLMVDTAPPALQDQVFVGLGAATALRCHY